jgi:uncharacterized protein YjbI with pentapeptide repeats
MSTLLIERDLRSSTEDSATEDSKEARTLARARTLTVLARVDPSRKEAVLQFLQEAALIQSVEGTEPIIRLDGANLSDTNLSDADMPSAALAGANLEIADLSDTDLTNTDLWGANLSGADLRGAILKRAVMNDATDLDGANLEGANLSDAELWWTTTEEQLSQAKSLEGATMPDGRTLKSDVNPDGPTFEEWLMSKSNGEE